MYVFLRNQRPLIPPVPNTPPAECSTMRLWQLLWNPNFGPEVRSAYFEFREARASKKARNQTVLEPSDDQKPRLLDLGDGTIEEWNTPLHRDGCSCSAQEGASATSAIDAACKIRIYLEAPKAQPDTPVTSGFAGFISVVNGYSSCEWIRVESFEQTGLDRAGLVRAVRDVRFVDADWEVKGKNLLPHPRRARRE